MLTQLSNFLKKYVPFTEDELNAMYECLELLNFNKGDVFIHEGQIAHHIAFSLEGYFRAYILHDGQDITRDITPVNSFFTALPSFVHGTPSFEVFEAITPAKALLIKKADLFALYDRFPAWERFGRMIIEEMFINVQYRLYLFITQTAEQRYSGFMNNYPDMLREVPLQYIAAFLGITQQSLSRLRKNIR
jgi:CRP-like cAMP-binding protein